MHEILTDAFVGACACQPGKPVLVGFSGGPDSLCLLHALHKAGVPVVAAHFNHHLRPSADHDAGQAAAITARLGIPSILGAGDVRSHAEQHGLSVETAARQLRYQFLFAEAARHQAQAVAVAHHADDQVETVLLHFLRGAGGAGLRGMSHRSLPNSWSETIPLVRPLLALWKEDLLAYCAANGLDFVEDESNEDQAYQRNAIRHTILPALAGFNPQIRPALWRMSQIAQDEQEVVAGAANMAWQSCLQDIQPGSVRLFNAAFQTLSPALQRLVLRRAIAVLRTGLADVDFAAIERARTAIIKNRTGTRVDLVGSLRLEMLGPALRLAAWEGILEAGWPQVTAPLELAAGTPADLGRSWMLEITPVALTAALRQTIQDNPDPFQAWVNPDILHGRLWLRPRWAGARFQPLGLAGGSQKLSDLMINHKIPQPARQSWPILCLETEIVWVPGMAVAHPFRVTREIQVAWHVTLHMAEPPPSSA